MMLKVQVIPEIAPCEGICSVWWVVVLPPFPHFQAWLQALHPRSVALVYSRPTAMWWHFGWVVFGLWALEQLYPCAFQFVGHTWLLLPLLVLQGQAVTMLLSGVAPHLSSMGSCSLWTSEMLPLSLSYILKFRWASGVNLGASHIVFSALFFLFLAESCCSSNKSEITERVHCLKESVLIWFKP